MSSSTALKRSAATALKRVELSRPVRLAVELGVIRSQDDVFDYGCGHGHDVAFLQELGHSASGWDPNHLPDGELRASAVVNLGYVLNVIEDHRDRESALLRAWGLARRALVVAVRTTDEAQFVANGSAHADGFLTGADTFQRFYSQSEARSFIDDVLGISAVPLAPACSLPSNTKWTNRSGWRTVQYYACVSGGFAELWSRARRCATGLTRSTGTSSGRSRSSLPNGGAYRGTVKRIGSVRSSKLWDPYPGRSRCSDTSPKSLGGKRRRTTARMNSESDSLWRDSGNDPDLAPCRTVCRVM